MKLSHAAIAATLSLALPIGAFAHTQTSETGETAAAQREVWRPTAEKLAKTHRVHLMQVRGFGDDAGVNADGPVLQPFVSDLADYLAANNIEKPAIVSHSMGGLAAMETEDCSAVNNTGTVSQGNMSNTQKGNCMVSNWSAAADKRVMAQAMYDGMITDMRADIAKITAPITVVYGRDERAFPTAMTDRLYTGNYAAAPQTELVPVDHSYHFVMLDQPKKMQAALDGFLID
jgi:pimeloyl-[acyl-carrier protein] methyl ester esterase